MLDAVKKILGRQRAYFGAKFNAQWQGFEPEELINCWESELRRYTKQELARGFEALRGLKFPPTLPEFMQLCRPSIDATNAYYEALKGVQDRTQGRKGDWSHPAIFWASARMASDLLNKTYASIKDQWKAELDKELEKTEWDEIPEVPLQLNVSIKKTDRNVALERMANIRAMVNKKPCTHWIERNMELIAKGVITNPTVIWMTNKAYREKFGI